MTYDIKYLSVKNDNYSSKIIKKALTHKGACLVDQRYSYSCNQKITPKLAFGSPIEDLMMPN